MIMVQRSAWFRLFHVARRRLRPACVFGFAILASQAVLLASSGCSGGGEAPCDPAVDVCDETGGSGNTGTAGGPVGSTSTTGTGGSTGSGGAPIADAARPFEGRIVGYLPTWVGAFDSWARDLPWTRMSHLNIAFATPSGSSFTLGTNQSAANLVAAAHAAGVKIMIAIGGAKGSDQIASLYTPGSVDAFVNNLVTYIDAQGFDGVDVDVEGNAVNGNYGPFIDKVVAKLRPKGKLVTAAVAQWYGNNISNATYGQFDFLNVMAYDHCGTWTSPCEHSTYQAAVDELTFFKSRAPVNKLVLGIPFYGYCWGTGCSAGTLPYLQIAVQYPGANDWIQMGGLTISYNSPATVLKKTQLARTYGGLMAWELTQDAAGTVSLLKTMAENL